MSRIVVGIDGSIHADRALRWAVREAEVRGAELDLVHAYPLGPRNAVVAEGDRAAAERTAETVAARNADLLAQVTWTTTLTPLLTASAAHALIEAGDEAELVVVGSRGLGGFGALLLGSTSYRTAGDAPCPVVVIRDDDTPVRAPRRVVVGIDDSRVARRALWWAGDEAERHGVPLTVVHAYVLPPVPFLGGPMTTAQMEELHARAHAEAEQVVARSLAVVDMPDGVTVETCLTVGSASGALIDQADASTLLVVGTRGHGALASMVIGSVSHQVLHHAPCPVVVSP